MTPRTRSFTRSALLAAAVVLLAAPARSEEAATAAPAAPAAPKPLNQAETLLLNMADTLGEAGGFRVHMRAGYDAVQPSGQKIQYLESRDVLLKRPDKLRVEAVSSSGEKNLLVFDGKTVTVSTPKANVYAQAEKPGSVDDAVRFFRKDLGVRLPLAAMLLSTVREELEKRMDYADYVETATLCGGKTYHHLAAVGEDVDMQVWLPTKGPALPHRIVLTYKHAQGQPQFWAEFSDWDLSPWAWDSKFKFQPPKDAHKIAFLPQLNSATPAAAQQ